VAQLVNAGDHEFPAVRDHVARLGGIAYAPQRRIRDLSVAR
jgi:hypothetical protein